MKLSIFIKWLFIGFALFIVLISGYFFLHPELLLTKQNNDKEDIANIIGKSQFEAYCASCHGIKGEGNGPSSITLSKIPPNFLKPNEIFVNGLTKNGVLKTMNQGIPQSQMPQFNYLPENVKNDIADYVLKLRAFPASKIRE